jgi:N6-adenosine-specific RNA methylase IME4
MTGAGLIRYDAACRALAEAYRVDEVKDIRDKAVAMQAYAKQAKDTSLITQATEIRMRAERRAGELLRETADTKQRHSGHGDQKTGSQAATPKLKDLGINKTQSSRWQNLAALPKEQFEAKVESASKAAYNSIARRFIKEEEIKRAKEQHAKIIAHGCTVDDLAALVTSGFRFGVIVPDFPWDFEPWSDKGKQRSAERHYDTWPLERIKAFAPLIGQLAASDCALLLWAIWPLHPAALEIIGACGFEYKTCGFIWVKTKPSAERIALDGDGLHWGKGLASTRSNTEVCLLATRGSPRRLSADVHQVVVAPVMEHSTKPDEIYRRIERLYPGPYLELFARRPRPGWTTWGDEIPRAQFVEAAE